MVQKPHTGSHCRYNQYAFKKISMGYKQNGVVITNTINNKENMKIHILQRLRLD